MGCFVSLEGLYFEGKVELAGWVTGASISGPEVYLAVDHLCGNPCGSRVWREDLVHVERLQKIEGAKEGWMEALSSVLVAPEVRGEDPNAALRREAEEEKRKLLEEAGDKDEDSGEKAKSSKKKKKKKKKKDKSQKVKSAAGIKPLADLFGGTGLDPEPETRRRSVKRARKIRKGSKKKKKSSGSKETSSTSTSSSSEGLDLEVYEASRETLKIWKKAPGALTCSTVVEAQQSLLDRQGVHPDVTTGALPAIMVQYFRGSLQPMMTPALSRESHHWCPIGPDAEGGSSESMRPGVPALESFGGLRKRIPTGGHQDAGVGASGKILLDQLRGGKSSREACVGRAEDPSKNKIRRKGQRFLPSVARWKERQKQRRWKERQQERRERRWEKGSQEQRRSQRKRLLERECEAREDGRDEKDEKRTKRGEAEKSGVPGGLDSWGKEGGNHEVFCMTGGLVTAGTGDKVSESACLPQGGIVGRIHSVTLFSDVLDLARDV